LEVSSIPFFHEKWWITLPNSVDNKFLQISRRWGVKNGLPATSQAYLDDPIIYPHIHSPY
jgi:hypothetical protein